MRHHGVEHAEILLETLQQELHLARFVHYARRAVVHQIARAAHLVDDYDVATLRVGQSAHALVTVRKQPLAVTARIDAHHEIGLRVELVQVREVVAYHDGYLAAAHFDDFVPLARDDESHLASRRNMLFLYNIAYTAVAQHRSRAHRAALGQHGRTHDGRAPSARLGDALQRLLAHCQKSGFTQQIVRRRAAHGILGEQHQIRTFALGLTDGLDDTGRIPFDIADRVIQLGKSYLHYEKIY